MRSLLVLMLLASTAYAETPQELTQTAHNIARDGRCEALPAIGKRVRELDEDYYTRVYSIDPVIAGCASMDAQLQVGGPPSMTPVRVIAPAPAPVGSPKSPDAALGLSLGMTAGGLGLMIAGAKWNEPTISTTGTIVFLVGPTTGHIYAGHTLNGGLAARAIGVLAGIAGLGLVLSCIDECGNNDNGDMGGVLLIGGGLLYVGGGLYEIATAPEAAHRYNREHGFEATVVPTGNGVALVGRF